MTDLVARCPALGPILQHAQEIAGYLWQRGWAEVNAGNLSIDLTSLLAEVCVNLPPLRTTALPLAYPELAGRYFLVTGSGRRFRDFARDPLIHGCLLRLNAAGDAYHLLVADNVPDFRPTSEFPSHLRVHQHLRLHQPRKTVVLHTHPTEIIALTHLPEYRDEAALNRALWSVHPEVKVNLPRGVGLTSYTLPGSERLAQATVGAFARGVPVAIWAPHGVVAIGDDVRRAFDLIDAVNKAAKVILLCRAAGHVPTGLNQEDLDELVHEFKLEQ